MNKLILDRTEDEILKIFLNGEEIFRTDHDEVGWNGIEALENYSEILAKKLKIKLIEN